MIVGIVEISTSSHVQRTRGAKITRPRKNGDCARFDALWAYDIFTLPISFFAIGFSRCYCFRTTFLLFRDIFSQYKEAIAAATEKFIDPNKCSSVFRIARLKTAQLRSRRIHRARDATDFRARYQSCPMLCFRQNIIISRKTPIIRRSMRRYVKKVLPN